MRTFLRSELFDFHPRGSAGTRVSYRVSEDRVHLIVPVPGASLHPDDDRPLKDGQQGQLHADREGPRPGHQQAQHPSPAEHDATHSPVQPQSRLHPGPVCRFVQKQYSNCYKYQFSSLNQSRLPGLKSRIDLLSSENGSLCCRANPSLVSVVFS